MPALAIATLVRRHSVLAALALATLLASACTHPWDDYEARGSATGSTTGTGSSPSPLCTELCAAYEACIGPDPGCPDMCAGLLTSCTTTELAELDECIAQLESCDVPAVAKALWNACLVQVGCYVP